MDIFFADDSKQRGLRHGMGSILSIGGVFIDEYALRPLAGEIDAIALASGIPEGTEIKWSPHKSSWIYQNLHGENRTNCYGRILETAAQFGARAIVVCWDLGRTAKQGEEAFSECLTYLFERITYDLRNGDRQAIIVADRPGGGRDQEETFLADFFEKVQKGTTYAVPDRVLLNVLTTPSHLVRHLQIADLVTGITTAMVCGNYAYARPLFDRVRPMLVRNTSGYVIGSGIKLWPNELANVYYWITGETVIMRGGGAQGFKIPTPHHPYEKDEGLPIKP
jgi:hypothetical protein